MGTLSCGFSHDVGTDFLAFTISGLEFLHRRSIQTATGLPATSSISKYWCGHHYFIPPVLLQTIRNLNVFIPQAINARSFFDPKDEVFIPQAWKLSKIFWAKKDDVFIPQAWKLSEILLVFDQDLDVFGPAVLDIVQNLSAFEQKDDVFIPQAWKLLKILLFLTKKMMFLSRRLGNCTKS